MAPEIQQDQVQVFRRLHNLKFDPEVMPADALFARLYREFKKRTLSVIPLEKVKTQAQVAPIIDMGRKRKLGEDLTIMISGSDHVPDTEVRTTVQILRVYHSGSIIRQVKLSYIRSDPVIS